jgi:stearoyl-CoA desaturase (Delta-9 desaturase)
VSFFTLGEGWHNYHHVFPYDYRSNELNKTLNVTKFFIQFMEKIGWAYDLRTARSDMVERRVKRMGDGTHQNWGTVGGMNIAADENELGY